MHGTESARAGSARSYVGGLACWLASRLRGELRPRPQLAVLERITLAPRQSLTLIEASGQRLLVATSADGTPAFYPVSGSRRQAGWQDKSQEKGKDEGRDRSSKGRVSW
jgi:flagellar biogenesis protein FliO